MLIGVSRQYKESGNCRLDAQDAMQREVPTIPLMLAEKYCSDSCRARKPLTFRVRCSSPSRKYGMRSNMVAPITPHTKGEVRLTAVKDAVPVHVVHRLDELVHVGTHSVLRLPPPTQRDGQPCPMLYLHAHLFGCVRCATQRDGQGLPLRAVWAQPGSDVAAAPQGRL